MTDPHEGLQEALGRRYEIQEVLGEGGMGTVYLAQDLQHERQVAIKAIHPHLATHGVRDRFEREIQITAHLQHPHILPLLDSGVAGETLYYVMPYVEGESLRDRLETEGTMPEGEIVQTGRDVASALDYAHQHDVVHRDIKPENILLTSDRAVVADFGISKAIGEDAGTGLTQSGMLVGTPAYMPPEQYGGEVTGRSDIYALGAVLYEALTGRRWPPGTSVSEADWSGVNPEMRSALARALEPSPKDRWEDAGAFRNALTAGGRSSSVPPEVGELAPKHGQESLIQRLTQRKLVQWAIAYVAGAWLILEVLGFVAENFGWPASVVRGATVLLGIGFFVNLVLAWYHGEKGQQRATGSELLIIAGLLLVAGGIVAYVSRGSEGFEVGSGQDLEALKLYNEGQFYLGESTDADVRQAVILFRQALEHDSTFVQAWVGLAQAYCTRSISSGAMDPREAMPNCKDAAERALAIDESVAAAHAALAQYHQDFTWDRMEAGREVHRALELDPNSADALMILAAYHSYAGRHDDAFEASARCIQVSPADPMAWSLAGVQYYLAERYDDALPYIERANEISPEYVGARWLEGAILAERGRHDPAIERLRPLAQHTGFVVQRMWLGYVYALAGEIEATQETLAQLLAEVSAGSPLSGNLAVAIAMIHIGMDNENEAFMWLDRSAELRSTTLPFVLISPVGKRLAGDPRYGALLERVRLPTRLTHVPESSSQD